MAENNDHFFKGFVIGGIVGAIAGLLLAPKSGKEFRAELGEESEKFLSKAREDLEHAKKAAVHTYEISKDKVFEKLHMDQTESTSENIEALSETGVEAEKEPAPKKRKSRKSKS
jgi:gas vesicle protein